jgi:hypothetical protein
LPHRAVRHALLRRQDAAAAILNRFGVLDVRACEVGHKNRVAFFPLDRPLSNVKAIFGFSSIARS